MLPTNFIEVSGDLLSDYFLKNVDYIAHQCNCTSTGSAGLYKNLVTKFPSLDVYRNRCFLTTVEDRPTYNYGVGARTKPGTITIMKIPGTHASVVHMFAQYSPGKHNETSIDNSKSRLFWFQTCLKLMTENILGNKVVAFPHKIGCNLAGGNWDSYRNCLINFAKENPRFTVYIVNKS